MSLLDSYRFAAAGGGGGGGTSPLIAVVGSKLYLHYQLGTGLYTDAGSTAATSNGDLIYQWNDQSGNGRHATQPTSANRPTLSTSVQHLSQNTLTFGSGIVSNALVLPDLSTLTEGEVFIVVKTNLDPSGSASGQSGGLWLMGTHAFASHYPYTDGVIYDGCGSTVRKTVGDPTPSLASQFRVYSVRSATNDWQAYLDNASLFSTGSSAVGFPVTPEIGRALNGTYNLDGWIAAFAICSPVLTGTERGNVYTALTT